MKPPLVRPYRDTDRARVIDALAALQDYEATLHDTRLPGHAVAEPYLGELLGIVAGRAGAIFVAEADGRFAGFVACCVKADAAPAETEDSRRYGYVSDIFVVPAERGSGLAQALLAAAERHLAAAGVSRIRVGVLAANGMARRAYEKQGFVPYEVVYEKRVPPSGGAPRNSPA